MKKKFQKFDIMPVLLISLSIVTLIAYSVFPVVSV